MMSMQRVLAILGFWLALAGLAQATVVWNVVTPQTCTAAGTPAFCCVTGNSADNAQSCNVQMNFGQFRELLVTFNPDGGTYTVGANFAANGDLVTAANFKKLGFDTVVSSICDATATKGYLPIITGRRSGSLRIHLMNPTTGAESTAVAIPAGTGPTVPGDQFDCLMLGY